MHIVQHADVQTHHDKSYVAKRNGNTDYVWDILCFSNNCMLLTADGIQEAGSGDCFIKAPEFIEYHYTPSAYPEGFINDWMHVQSREIESLLLQLKLPVNTIIRTQYPELVRGSIQRILNEKRDLLPYYEETIHNLVERVLIKIARAAMETATPSSSKKYEEGLRALRLKLQSSLERQWSIGEMACQLGISTSRLSVLYKERFGLSPNEDLIHMRIDKAKLLLLSTDLKLQNIAQMCGFKNEYYFSRVFKEREDMAPGAFRRWG